MLFCESGMTIWEWNLHFSNVFGNLCVEMVRHHQSFPLCIIVWKLLLSTPPPASSQHSTAIAHARARLSFDFGRRRELGEKGREKWRDVTGFPLSLALVIDNQLMRPLVSNVNRRRRETHLTWINLVNMCFVFFLLLSPPAAIFHNATRMTIQSINRNPPQKLRVFLSSACSILHLD